MLGKKSMLIKLRKLLHFSIMNGRVYQDFPSMIPKYLTWYVQSKWIRWVYKFSTDAEIFLNATEELNQAKKQEGDSYVTRNHMKRKQKREARKSGTSTIGALTTQYNTDSDRE